MSPLIRIASTAELSAIFGVSRRNGPHSVVMVPALYIATGALEVAGLIIVGVGFRRTWREHARGQDFWEPPKRWARSAWDGIVTTARRISRRPRRKAATYAYAGTGGIAFGGSASTTFHIGELPDPATEPARFAQVVHKRLDELNVATQDLQRRLATEAKAREQADAKLREYVDVQRQDADDQTRTVAVGGLRLEFVGWLFLLAGIVFGTVANMTAYLTT